MGDSHNRESRITVLLFIFFFLTLLIPQSVEAAVIGDDPDLCALSDEYIPYKCEDWGDYTVCNWVRWVTHYHSSGYIHSWSPIGGYCRIEIAPKCDFKVIWWFAEGTDNDNDGFQAIGFCPSGDDCDDNDPTVNPGVKEICDGKDNDCDGLIDEDCGGGDGTCEEEPNSTDIGSSASFASGNLFHSQQIFGSQGWGLAAGIYYSL
jgi:hypothetical protein